MVINNHRTVGKIIFFVVMYNQQNYYFRLHKVSDSKKNSHQYKFKMLELEVYNIYFQDLHKDMESIFNIDNYRIINLNESSHHLKHFVLSNTEFV
jgi:hypothetical protein